MYIIVSWVKQQCFFSKISAIFQGDEINKTAGLLELIIQTKTFSSLDANKSR